MVDHAVAVSNATCALHIACLALDVGPGDVVWTSPVTFVASANCALYCNAAVDFVDIDPRTFNMSVELLKQKLKKAEAAGNLPSVVIPVHFGGQPCDMASIHALGQRYDFRIIEDASHAIGATYEESPIGRCEYSDIAVFSFHPVKIITTGEGGMTLTSDQMLAERMRRCRTHGFTHNREEMQPRPSDEIWNYQQISLGYNYRMTDIQAALGTSQLTRLDEFISRRNQIAQRYDDELQDLPVRVQQPFSKALSSYHLYPIRLNLGEIGKSQRQVYDAMRNAGILVNLHYIPVYLQPYYEALGFTRGYCPEAESYYREALTIPMYPAMTDDQQTLVIETLRKVLSN